MNHRLITAAAVVCAAAITLLPVSAFAADPPAAPPVGSCHAVTMAEFSAASDPDPAVSCSATHQSLTVKAFALPSGVGRTDQQRITDLAGKQCYPAVAARVGGWPTMVRSLYDLLLFVPTQSQWDAGARWVRCDLFLWAAKGIQALPASGAVGGSLSARETRCNAGKSASYAPVPCSRPHQFHAKVAIRMPSWNGASAARTFAQRACVKRYPHTGFLASSPPSKKAFDWGFRYAVCAPATTH